MKKTIALAIATCWLGACSSISEQPDGSSLQNSTGQPALHAVRDQQLHELMNKMNRLMMERFMTEHELDIERRKQTRQITEAAKSLAETGAILLDRLPALKLEPSEQDTFRALARKLRQQARTLQQQAENNSVDVIPATLQEMKATCTACHTLFRKL